jgi:hypothetical protein
MIAFVAWQACWKEMEASARKQIESFSEAGTPSKIHRDSALAALDDLSVEESASPGSP